MASPQDSTFRKVFLSKIPEYFGVFTAIISVLMAIVGFYVTTRFEPKITLSNPNVLSEEISQLKNQLDDVRKQQTKLGDDLKALTQIPEQAKLGIELSRVDNSIAEIQTKQTKLEQVIMDNPAKALEVPLMRRDLEGLKEKNQADLLAVRQEVDRIYDQNKWFLGLMGTMAIGILTLAVSNFFKKEKAS